MSRAILCLVFVAILASIGQGRVIEKRSPLGFDVAGQVARQSVGLGRKKRSPGGASDLAAKIDKAVDLKAIGGHIDKAIDAVEDFGSDAIDWTKGAANTVGDFFGGLGRKKRSPGVGADLAGKIDKAVDLKAIGGHIDKAIDAVEDFGSDAIDWTKGAANTVGDFFGGLGRKKRSPGVGADLAGKIDKAVDLEAIGGHIDKAIDKIGDFGSDAIDGIKDFLG